MRKGQVTPGLSFFCSSGYYYLKEITVLQVAIRDTDKTPMWSLPGTRLFLSFESPGPIDIDIKTLTLEQQKVIAQEISRSVLVAQGIDELHAVIASSGGNNASILNGGKGSLAKSYSKIKLVRDDEEGYVVKMPEQKQAVQPEIFLDPVEERHHVLKEFLSQHVATVKKDLPGRSLSELRIIRDLEGKDKNRASVLKLVNELISKAQADVFHSIQKSYNPKLETKVVQADLPKQYLDNVTSVVESDHKEVTIKLGADDNE